MQNAHALGVVLAESTESHFFFAPDLVLPDFFDADLGVLFVSPDLGVVEAGDVADLEGGVAGVEGASEPVTDGVATGAVVVPSAAGATVAGSGFLNGSSHV